jgi:hypothetical protein
MAGGAERAETKLCVYIRIYIIYTSVCESVMLRVHLYLVRDLWLGA